MADKQSVGVYLDGRLVDKADELKRERDRLGRRGNSRSAVLQDSITIGLTALQIVEEEMPRAGRREQRDAVRATLRRHFVDDHGSGRRTDE